MIRKRTN